MLLLHELELRATTASVVSSPDLAVAVPIAVAASDVCFTVPTVAAAALHDWLYGFRGRGGREQRVEFCGFDGQGSEGLGEGERFDQCEFF